LAQLAAVDTLTSLALFGRFFFLEESRVEEKKEVREKEKNKKNEEE
jgi:hypothetical protein